VPTWNSDQYLRFARERTQPAEDLARRIDLFAPRRIIDLGCGPGNSTAVLVRRWPEADVAGLDSSAAMIEAARRADPARRWMQGDLADWKADAPHDLVFSNAALQWAPDHPRVVPQLLQQVASGGALAFQVPANFDAAPHRLMREIAGSAR
jgi:trans-aconitate 2-methyltransferase